MKEGKKDIITKNLYLFVGRSGSGKTTVANILEKEFGYKQVQSYTTRPKRYKTETGHTFISKKKFNKLNLVAYTSFNGYEYGVDKELLDKSSLYVIDIEGVKYLKERYTDRDLILINIRCDKDVLKKNMQIRGDSSDMISGRLANDDIMFAEENTFAFDYIVENNSSVEDLAARIAAIIITEENFS